MKWMTALAVSFALASPCAWAGDGNLPEFRSLESKPVSLTEWRGHAMLVAFWRSDCLPCLKEMKLLPDMAKANPNLPIALISLQDAEHTAAHLSPMPDNVHVLLAEGDGKQVLTAFGDDKALALPFSAMLDKNGSVCARHYGILGVETLKVWQKACS